MNTGKVPADHKEASDYIHRENMYAHVRLWVYSHTAMYFLLLRTLHKTTEGELLKNKIQDTELVLGKDLEGWEWKMKSNNGTEKWKHKKQ